MTDAGKFDKRKIVIIIDIPINLCHLYGFSHYVSR